MAATRHAGQAGQASKAWSVLSLASLSCSSQHVTAHQIPGQDVTAHQIPAVRLFRLDHTSGPGQSRRTVRGLLGVESAAATRILASAACRTGAAAGEGVSRYPRCTRMRLTRRLELS